MNEMKITILQPLQKGSIKAETRIDVGMKFSYLLNNQEMVTISFEKETTVRQSPCNINFTTIVEE